jgi:hypothetical protein
VCRWRVQWNPDIRNEIRPRLGCQWRGRSDLPSEAAEPRAVFVELRILKRHGTALHTRQLSRRIRDINLFTKKSSGFHPPIIFLSRPVSMLSWPASAPNPLFWR